MTHNARALRRLKSLAVLAAAPVLIAATEEKPPIWNIAGRNAVRVWIQQTYQREAVVLAVGDWNAQALPLRFRFGSDSTEADIRVYWIEKFDEPISGRTTTVDEGKRYLVKADVVLARRHSDGRKLTREEMRVLAMHELGHAIGLEHIDDSTSVMAARVRVRTISSSDRRRAMNLYSTNTDKGQ